MQEKYADVIIGIAHPKLDRSFQYRIPSALADRIAPGVQVRVPFGRGDRLTDAYVIACSDAAEIEADRIKDIAEVIDEAVTIESRLIRLAAAMRRTYGATMLQSLRTVLPVKEKKEKKRTKHIALAIERNRAEAALDEAEKKHHTARARLLSYLLTEGSITQRAADQDLKVSRDAIRALAERGIVRVEEETIRRDPVELKVALEAFRESVPGAPTGTIPLTDDQRAVRDAILSDWEQAPDKPALIEGVTGSGKTQIYLALAQEVLAKGRAVIVLIPEIALSGQIVRRFTETFGNTVAILHSRMSAGERSDQYDRIGCGAARVVIGPRSALFAPCMELGLIVIDEEQERAYQNEEAPHYDAREVAIMRAEQEQAHVVLGSATPSLDSRYACDAGRYRLHRLSERYGGARLPDVSVVDMRSELRTGNRSPISAALQEAIRLRLAAGEQTMLFLNRRGMAGFLSCRSCGHVIKCPHCDVSLTAHCGRRMVCHYCGYETAQAAACPSCGSKHITGFRAGTQQIEQEIQGLFPDARILRMDADTTRRKGGHAEILRTFSSGGADILVGTQMIVKGHDLPNVTLVGILLADLSLFASDYRAAERTYQLLVQAVGRAGRGSAPGEALIQTYRPDHPCILAAVRQDYEAFYEEEKAMRELLGYPPAASLLAVRGSAEDEERLALAMQYIRKYLERIARGKDVRLIGPAPESVAKIQDRYRCVLYAKGADQETLIRLRLGLEAYIEINRGFDKVRIQYDLNT